LHPRQQRDHATSIAIEEPRTMSAEPLRESDWDATLEELSSRYRGESTAVTVVDPQRGRRLASVRLPLVRVTTDTGALGRSFAVVLRDQTGVPVTRFIEEPDEVLMDTEPDGARLRVLIHTREGLSTVIEVARGDDPSEDDNECGRPAGSDQGQSQGTDRLKVLSRIVARL
jgi:hypothetical protein